MTATDRTGDPPTARPTVEDIQQWFTTLSNWGRWGTDDVLGTLNLITADRRLQAIQSVETGTVVSCSQPITYEATPDAFTPSRHWMMTSGEIPPANSSYGRTSVLDHFFFAPHGVTMTHLDAPGHTLWRNGPDAPRTLYNGQPDTLVTMTGAHGGASIDIAGGGIVGRGVLLDLPAALGVDWLEPGTAIHPGDLEAAEQRQQTQVTAGDILFIRTGHIARRRVHGPVDPPDKWSGLQAACLPWLRERDIAVLGCDTGQDVHPPEYPSIGAPVHGVGMVAMGLWFLDNVDHEALLPICRQHERWHFLVVVSPLKWHGGTGSPVNPLAIF